MIRKVARLVVWILVLGVAVGVELGASPQSAEAEIDSNEELCQVLGEMLVGVSNACFALCPDTADGPFTSSDGISFDGFRTSLDYRWLAIADLAIGGSAYLQSATDASRMALMNNLQETMIWVGDLAANLLRPLPLIIEIHTGTGWFDDAWSAVGWITFDEESLRCAQIPDMIEADYPLKQLGFYANDVVRELGRVTRTDEWNAVASSSGYFPGIGIFLSFEPDWYGGLLPRNLNTVPKWKQALPLIFGKLDTDVLSSMAADERVIISVEGFIARDKTFFMIGVEDLLEPAAWEIVYWK